MFPKILISAPTSAAKNYCLEEYLTAVHNVEYPNFTLRLFDNTLDGGVNVAHINATILKLLGHDDRFLAVKTDTLGLEGSLIARICQSHNDARTEALTGGYDYLLHLESDVIIKPHFLQELVLHKKPVVGALYYRDESRFRKLMVQTRLNRSPNNVFMRNLDPDDDLAYINGGLKEAGNMGLGCLLIRIDVLKKIMFRYVHNLHVFPDSFFAEDCLKHKIKILADTSLICDHKNSNWQLQVYTKTNKA